MTDPVAARMADALHSADLALLSAQARTWDYRRWAEAILAALPPDAHLFTVETLAAISRAVPMSMDDYWLEESGIVRFDHDAYATAIIQAAKEAERE